MNSPELVLGTRTHEEIERLRVLKTDRSRIVARQECPRLRYLNYHLGGMGLEPRVARIPLVSGIHYHQALAEIVKGVEPETALAATVTKFTDEINERGLATIADEDLDFIRHEQVALLGGIVRGWVYIRLERLLDEYDIVDVEREFEFEPEPGLVAMLRFDLVVRHRATGLLYLGDFKGMAYAGEDWAKKQEHDAQWKLYLEGAEAFYQERVDGVFIEGLVKGSRKRETARTSPWLGKKLQQSPYCYGYTDGTAFQAGYTSRKGWNKTPSWEAMAHREWFDRVLTNPDDLTFNLADQFIAMPPICPPKAERKRWLRQVVHQELLWAETVRVVEAMHDDMLAGDMEIAAFEDTLDLLVPQHDSRCVKFGWDNACQFLNTICYNAGALSDPIGTGDFLPRVPHHAGELDD
jgi:hypothetical protein